MWIRRTLIVVICVLVGALSYVWVRSYWVTDAVGFGGSRIGVVVESSGGRAVGNIDLSPRGVFDHSWRGRRPFLAPWVQGGVFNYGWQWIGHRGYGRLQFHTTYHIPVAFLLILLLLLIRPIRTIITRQRRRRGLCIKCAYDLTGNESGVCPECGTGVETVKGA